MTSRSTASFCLFPNLIGGRGGLFCILPHRQDPIRYLSAGEKPLLTTANKNKKCPSSSDRMGTPPTPLPLQPLLHHHPSTPPPPGAPLRMWFWCYCCPRLKSEPEEGNEAPTDTLTFFCPPLLSTFHWAWMTQRVIKGGVEEEEAEERLGSGCSWV